MSKRKTTIDLSSRSFKVQKSRGESLVITTHRQGEKRRRHCEIHYPSVKQCIRPLTPVMMVDIEPFPQVYLCSIHDDDRDVCLIYDCSGGERSTDTLYNYIN